MSGPDSSVTPPPEVPEEFADAYRQAYERALAEGAPTAETPTGAQHRAPKHEHRGAHRAEPPADEPRAQPPAEESEDWTEYSVESPYERFRASRWFVPSLLALAAALLVVGAYGVGRMFAMGVNEAAPAGGQANQATIPASQPSAHHRGKAKQTQQARAHKKSHTTSKPPRKPGPWHGPVTPVRATSASAGCEAAPGVDAAGYTVTYQPANAVDGRPDTAWRCPGQAIGQRLVVHLPGKVAVGEVGLIPGYAKTDPVSGADRYAENNRITSVRWILGSGRSVVQHLSGSAGDRSLRTIRVPRTTTRTVTLEVLAVRTGPRLTTCVSEVRVGRVG